MHITVINPNTTASMTELIGESARAVAAPGRGQAVNPAMGPASIESHYDEALSVPGLLEEIARAQAGGPAADGFVIACFGDPGLDAARELADGPVVGIAEAAMHAASFLGRGFSVVTTLGRTRPGLGPRRALRDDPVLPERAGVRDPGPGPGGPGVGRVRGDRRRRRRAVERTARRRSCWAARDGRPRRG